MLPLLFACVSRFAGPDATTTPDSDTVVTDTQETSTTDDSTPTTESTPTDDSGTTETKTAPPLVMMVTQDAMSRTWYGWRETARGWDTTPYQDSLLTQGVLLPDVLSSRALTGVSLASLITGVYPNRHGIRDNGDEWPDLVPTIQDQFRAAGYFTIFIAANRCELGEQRKPDFGWDYFACTYRDRDTGGPTQAEADVTNVDLLVEQLDLHPDVPKFVWVHFMDPHEDYEAAEPYYSQFHPDEYTGTLDAGVHPSMEEVTLGEHGYDDEDRRYYDAMYASEVRSTDTRIEDVMKALHERDLFEDATIAIGADHGQENATRPDLYFYHGCTYYNEAAMTQWYFKSPGLPAGTLPGFVPNVDIAPTLLELAGVAPDSSMVFDGASLVDDMLALTDPEHDGFVERGTRAAGVVSGDYKYVLNPDGDFIGCTPYTAEFPYVTPEEELYDLAADPGETNNLVDSLPGVVADMKERLCGHVNDGIWSGSTSEDASNALRLECD